MGLNKAFDRYFTTNQGATKRDGGSINIAVGQIGIRNIDGVNTKEGKAMIDSFQGISPNDKLEIIMGKPDLGVSRSLNNKPYTSIPFTLDDVREVKVYAPKGGDEVDDFVIGFNGDDDSEFELNSGDTEIIQIMVEGDGIGFLGYKGQAAFTQVTLIAPDGAKSTVQGDGGWTDQEVWENAYERLKRSELAGQIPLTDYADIILVNSENPATLPGTAQTFYNLTINDLGDYSSLGRVQAQYPDLNVKRKDFVEGTGSTYTAIATTAPADYTVGLADLLKGCEDCPAGYTELSDGFVYSVELEDDGADSTAAVQAIANAELASAVKNGQEQGTGSGFYSVVTTQKLTQAEIDAFVDTNPTAIVKLVSNDVAELCTNATTTDTAWVAGEACNTTTEDYTLRVADDKCGESVLEKIQAAYPDLTITEVAGSESGCFRTYQTTVETSLVCEECDPIYRELFTSEAPQDYMNTSWTKAEKVYNVNAKMGIRVRAKKTRLAGSEAYRDYIPFVATSPRLKVVGGFKNEVNENYSVGENGRMNVKIISRQSPPISLGGDLRPNEESAKVYFDSATRHYKNPYANFTLGEESQLDDLTPYVDYIVTVHKRRYAQSFADKVDVGITYHIYAPVGKHQDVESLVNDLATAAGLPAVQAYAKA